MHDIVSDKNSIADACCYYAKEFADNRRNKPPPYMKGLRFQPAKSGAADQDTRILSDDDLDQARRDGESRLRRTDL